MTVILFFIFFKFSMIFDSISESKELVASSNINISGFLKRALAIHNLCLCPPDRLLAFSLIILSSF